MFLDTGVPTEPDKIVPEKNFLLLQADLVSQIKAVVTNFPPSQELCLQFKEGLYFLDEQIFVGATSDCSSLLSSPLIQVAGPGARYVHETSLIKPRIGVC